MGAQELEELLGLIRSPTPSQRRVPEPPHRTTGCRSLRSRHLPRHCGDPPVGDRSHGVATDLHNVVHLGRENLNRRSGVQFCQPATPSHQATALSPPRRQGAAGRASSARWAWPSALNWLAKKRFRNSSSQRLISAGRRRAGQPSGMPTGQAPRGASPQAVQARKAIFDGAHAEAGQVVEVEVLQGVGTDEAFGGLDLLRRAPAPARSRRPGCPPAGRWSPRRRRPRPATKRIRCWIRVLGTPAVGVVVAHLVADPVGAPAQRQLRQVAGAHHQAACGGWPGGTGSRCAGPPGRSRRSRHRPAGPWRTGGPRSASICRRRRGGCRSRSAVTPMRVHQLPGVRLGAVRGGEARQGVGVGCRARGRPSWSMALAATVIRAWVEIQPAGDADHQALGARGLERGAPGPGPGCCRPRSSSRPALAGSDGVNGKRSIEPVRAERRRPAGGEVDRHDPEQRRAAGSASWRRRSCRPACAPGAAVRRRRRRWPSPARSRTTRALGQQGPISWMSTWPSQARSVELSPPRPPNQA